MTADIKIGVRDLDSVVLKDSGSKIKDSGKWPLLMDTVGVASTFLRHRDTNYLEAMNAKAMEKEKLRMALMGALRYGKPLVLDMQDADMFELCAKLFDEVQPGLMKTILDKSILDEKEYSKLITDADLPEYDRMKFSTEGFMFVILTTLQSYPDELAATTFHIVIE